MPGDRNNWLALVEIELIRRYCLDFEDLGWDEMERNRYFAYGLKPDEFAVWLGEKYGLESRSSAYGLT